MGAIPTSSNIIQHLPVCVHCVATCFYLKRSDRLFGGHDPRPALWLNAAIQAMDDKRKLTFQTLKGRHLCFGSDCTGADSAFSAAKIWALKAEATVSNEMCSEAPNAHGPTLLILLNHNPKRFYKDMLARGHSGFCLINNQRVQIPLDLEFYAAGTMCTDFSGLNTLNPKPFLSFS